MLMTVTDLTDSTALIDDPAYTLYVCVVKGDLQSGEYKLYNLSHQLWLQY